MNTLAHLNKEPYALSTEEINRFKADGYLVIEQLFSIAECDAMMDIFRTHANKQYAAILNLDRQIEELASVMKSPRLVNVLETLQDHEIVGLLSQVIFKAAHSDYSRQAWQPHQDNSYPQCPNHCYITINIFLDDYDEENGGMFIYPGSHKEGLYPFSPTPSYREKIGHNPGNCVAQEIIDRFEPNKVNLQGKKGDTLIMIGEVVHGSYPNLSDRSRPLYSISYANKGAPFIQGRNGNRQIMPLH